MAAVGPNEITDLLRRVERGEPEARDQFARLVHTSLRRIAANRLRRERPGHLYQTSDLVQEAYIRLFKIKNIHWEGREHFFKIAAMQMRRILVEFARREYRGHPVKVSLQDVPGLTINDSPGILTIDEIMNDLARIDPRRAEIAELKYFGGFGIEEIARITGIPGGTVKRHWATAKTFIKHQLGDPQNKTTDAANSAETQV
ncbi:MAG: ECF-type sigma factor [Blastocatellia bacterium]